MIRIIVAPHPMTEGIDHLNDQGDMLTAMRLTEVMEKEWAVDAHFYCYAPVNPNGVDLASIKETEAWPRINKPCLGQIRQAGGDLRTNLFTFDYDNNQNVDEQVLRDAGWGGNRKKLPKLPWTPKLMEDFAEKLVKARAYFEDHNVARANYVYTTRNGARFVHVLSEGIPVDQSEDYLRGLFEVYARAGLVMDPACQDWTRCFRLPRVARDGAPTWTSPFFRCVNQVEEFLDVDGIEPIKKAAASEYAEIKELDIPLPTPDEAMRLLEMVKDNRVLMTTAHKTAKKILKNMESFPIIFEHQPLATTGTRDHTLMKIVGQVATYLHAYNEHERINLFTPQHAYALLLPAVQDLDPDAGTPSWEHSLWSKVLRCWAREEAKAVLVRRRSEEQEDQVVDKIQTMLEGVRRWAPSISHLSHEQALEMLTQILLVGTPSGTYHILQPDGYYTEYGVRSSHVKATIRELGMNDVIQFERFDGGRVVKNNPEDLLTEHGTIVSRVIGRIAVDGAFVDNLRTRDATLVLPMFRRVNMEPKFNENVDRWLRQLVESGDDYLRLCKWIGYALDFEGGPICALSLAGPPSVGKKLLARGLSEAVNTATAASGFDMVQNFNVMLSRTPFLVVDEGLPGRLPGGMDIADKFRQLVAGETIVVNEKYQTPMTINNPLRIIFTANNHEVIQQLTKHRDLSPDDQHALGIRILHFEAQHAAAQYLACPDSNNPDFGGLAFTRGWIAGDAGQPSDYIVARHFLWLYANRANYGSPEPRYLVEGSIDSRIMQEMATNSGCAPDVIETILSMIEDIRANLDGISIDMEGGRLYVTSAGILSYFRSDLAAARRILDNRKIAGVLKSLALQNPEHATTRITRAGNERKFRWWMLDTVRLLKFAVDNGMKYTKLEALVRTTHGDTLVDSWLNEKEREVPDGR